MKKIRGRKSRETIPLIIRHFGQALGIYSKVEILNKNAPRIPDRYIRKQVYKSQTIGLVKQRMSNDLTKKDNMSSSLIVTTGGQQNLMLGKEVAPFSLAIS